MKSRMIRRKLNKEKKYSEEEIVLFLEKYMKKSLSGDTLASAFYGEEENIRLVGAIAEIDDGELDVFVKFKNIADKTFQNKISAEQREERMFNDLLYFVKRVREGSIRSTKTYERYIKTLEAVSGKSIDELLITSKNV